MRGQEKLFEELVISVKVEKQSSSNNYLQTTQFRHLISQFLTTVMKKIYINYQLGEVREGRVRGKCRRSWT